MIREKNRWSSAQSSMSLKNHEYQNQSGSVFSVHKPMLSPQGLGHSAEGSDESDKGVVQPRPRFPAWGLLCSVLGSVTSRLRDKPHHFFLPYFISAASEVKILKYLHHTGIFSGLCVFALSAWGFTNTRCSTAAKWIRNKHQPNSPNSWALCNKRRRGTGDRLDFIQTGINFISGTVSNKIKTILSGL